MYKIAKLKGLLDSLNTIVIFNTNPLGDILISRGNNAHDVKSIISQMNSILKEFNNDENKNNTSPSSKEEPHKEMVSHPAHYQGNKIECIEAMLDVFGKEKVSAFCELNAFKYQWRADKKGTDLQDKRKAIWYLDKYIELNKEEK